MKNREEFDSLEVIYQIEYINKELENKSLTEICKDIKISRSTLRERFLKQGYVFNKYNNKYEYPSEANKEVYKNKKYEIDTKALEEKIQGLESKIESIESVLKNNCSMNIKKFEGKTVSRCYRLYEDVQKEFSKFCKENSRYKVQDILSMALYEYMKNSKYRSDYE